MNEFYEVYCKTIQKLSRQSRNCPDNKKVSKKFKNCPDNAETVPTIKNCLDNSKIFRTILKLTRQSKNCLKDCFKEFCHSCVISLSCCVITDVVIYALHPENFCSENLAIRKGFCFFWLYSCDVWWCLEHVRFCLVVSGLCLVVSCACLVVSYELCLVVFIDVWHMSCAGHNRTEQRGPIS